MSTNCNDVDAAAGSYSLVILSTACAMSFIVVSIGLAITGR